AELARAAKAFAEFSGESYPLTYGNSQAARVSGERVSGPLWLAGEDSANLGPSRYLLRCSLERSTDRSKAYLPFWLDQRGYGAWPVRCLSAWPLAFRKILAVGLRT